jgi:hypothetical protein
VGGGTAGDTVAGRGRPPVGGVGGPGWEGARAYFVPHAEHTAYAARSAAGRSIGSGLVEGACKQVVGRRRKQAGARWTVRRAERMASPCAVQASGQWEACWASLA